MGNITVQNTYELRNMTKQTFSVGKRSFNAYLSGKVAKT